MTEQAIAERTVGELAASLPGATAVFREFRLDFCCGGDVPLAQAAAKRGADLELLVARLARLSDDSGSAVPESDDELLALIGSRYQALAGQDLPEFIRLSRKVEAVHANSPAVPRGLAQTLAEIHQALQSHVEAENAALSRDGVEPSTLAPFREDHARLGEQLRRIETITGDFQLPPEACRSWQALYLGTQKLVEDVMDYIHLEGNVLYPRLTRSAA